jgi:hypothetical protein
MPWRAEDAQGGECMHRLALAIVGYATPPSIGTFRSSFKICRASIALGMIAPGKAIPSYCMGASQVCPTDLHIIEDAYLEKCSHFLEPEEASGTKRKRRGDNESEKGEDSSDKGTNAASGGGQCHGNRWIVP